jgi:hypothetical protein
MIRFIKNWFKKRQEKREMMRLNRIFSNFSEAQMKKLDRGYQNLKKVFGKRESCVNTCANSMRN